MNLSVKSIKYQHLRTWFVQIVLGIFTTIQVLGQDITDFKNAKPFKMTGSVYGGFYSIQSTASSIPPLGYQTGIHLNFSFYQHFNIPVSLSYSNRSTDFNTATFRRLGISPTYKWIKIHGGYRSYLLNQYLLAGKTIIGGGIELSPKRFHFLAFAGKVDDPYSLGNDYIFAESLNNQFYNRWMYGVKIGFGPETNRITLSGIRTSDKTTLTSDTLIALGIHPRDNFALSLDLKNTFLKIFNFNMVVAASVMTSDRNGRAVETDDRGTRWLENLSFLADINQTTRWGFAGKAGLGMRLKNINIGFNYENTQPNYAALGVSFIQNNFENYLIDLGGTLFKRFTFLTSFGLHYVNKSGFTGKPQQRTALNANVSWPVTKELTLSGNYINFVQKPQATFEQVLDTFAITANSTGYNVAVNYKIGGSKSPHNLNGYYSDNSFDILGFESVVSRNNSTNSSLSYRYTPKDKLNYGGGVQYNTNQLNENTSTQRFGFLCHTQKSFKNNISLRLDGGYRLNKTNNQADGSVINYSTSVNYTIVKKHRLSLAFSQLFRNTTILNSKNITNFRANYYYSF